MPMLALTDAHRAQYVCMDSSCAECAIDAWTLLAIITSSRRGGSLGAECVCVCVLPCLCVYQSLLPSWLFESWVVAMSESVKLLFKSPRSLLLVQRICEERKVRDISKRQKEGGCVFMNDKY